MIIDIAIVLAIGLFGFLGFKNGILFGVPRFISLILSIIIAYFVNAPLTDFLRNSTPIYDSYKNEISANCGDFIKHYADKPLNEIPFGISNLIKGATSNMTNYIIEKISLISFSVIVFVITVILIKIIFMLLIYHFYKKNTTGILGGIDGFLGLLLGVFKGIVIVFLVMIFIVPFSFLVNPSFNETINYAIKDSIILNFLEGINPLSHLSKNFNLEMLLPGSWGGTDDLLTDAEKDLSGLI